MQPVLQPVCTRALAGTGIAQGRPEWHCQAAVGLGNVLPRTRTFSQAALRYYQQISRFCSRPFPGQARSSGCRPARGSAAGAARRARSPGDAAAAPREAPAQGRLSRGPEAASETSQEEEQVTPLWVSEAQMLWVPQGTQAGLRDRGGTQQSFLAWVWCNLHMQMSLDWP